MAVVLVRRDRVPAEAAVVGDVRRQIVVMPEQDRLAVASDHQLRRKLAVERPQLVGTLIGEVRVESGWKRSRRIDPGIQARRYAWVVHTIDFGAFLRNFDGDPRREHIEQLM